MNVLLTGATGLIGTELAARLASLGHKVTGVVRPGRRAVVKGPLFRIVELDIARAGQSDWSASLEGIDAVINSAGTLQEGAGESTSGVHARGADALFAACEAKGVRRIIHFSAIGVDRRQLSSFSQSKLAGDEALMRRDLDWVVLRPSVVLGRPVFGASALMRGLSALPVVPRVEDAGALQVVQLEDVVETVARILETPEINRVALELAGPEKLSFNDVVATYRRWQGWREARRVTVPGPLFKALYRLGDLAGQLGWRPAMRTNARLEVTAGAVGDPSAWSAATGIAPRSLESVLKSNPATVQDRWFARLFFLKPLGFVIFALFWISTGVISIGPGYNIGVDTMEAGGAGWLSGPIVIAGGLADLAIGIGIAFRRTTRISLYAALIISLVYAAIGTAILPALWIEPLGPMTKIWPIIALNLFLLAILEER